MPRVCKLHSNMDHPGGQAVATWDPCAAGNHWKTIGKARKTNGTPVPAIKFVKIGGIFNQNVALMVSDENYKESLMHLITRGDLGILNSTSEFCHLVHIILCEIHFK